jgi:pimeloyl-ACP methyl ester carboxylesterase
MNAPAIPHYFSIAASAPYNGEGTTVVARLHVQAAQSGHFGHVTGQSPFTPQRSGMSEQLEVRRFKSEHDELLDCSLSLPDKLKGILVFCPCAFGNAQAKFYQLPESSLLSAGYGVFRYNPRSHGKSTGTYSAESAVGDLLNCLSNQFPASTGEVPVIGVGHSMGAATVLLSASTVSRFARLFLVAPVLNSRESLLYKYKNGTSSQFSELFRTTDSNNHMVQEILSTPSWTDYGTWKDQRLRERLDFPLRSESGVALVSFAEFLESFFIANMDASGQLKAIADRCLIIFPTTDEWYPPARTREFAETLHIPHREIADKTGHALRDSWPLVWETVLQSLLSPM